MDSIDDSHHGIVDKVTIEGTFILPLYFILSSQLISTTEETPSLLTIILDTNPHAWALLNPTLTLSKTLSTLLVFINAHLAFSAANQVAVIASHSQRAVFLYPRPPRPTDLFQDGGIQMSNADGKRPEQQGKKAPNNPNKYRPFSLIEHDLLASLRELIDTTTPEDLASSTTQVAGALTLALSHINKQTVLINEAVGATTSTQNADGSTSQPSDTATVGLLSRILILSVSGDLAYQYIPIMNSVFAAQSLRIPIDILKLSGDTVFLQQASDATKGTYIEVKEKQGLLGYLMVNMLPDQAARRGLVKGGGDVVDFRAACFCHQRVVETGFVCSICLSSKFSF